LNVLAHLLAIHIDIDPEITEIGPFLLTWHGFFTALGIVAGVYLSTKIARVKGIPTDEIYNAAMPVVFGGIVGARTLFVIENFDDFQSDPLEVFALTEGGISVLGALLGGSLAVWLYVIFAGLPWARCADVAVPGVIFGFSLGRIGDIINGEHIGAQSDLPWATVYEHPNSPAFLLPAHHPAVAYEMILGLLLTAVLVYMVYRMQWLRDGWVAVVGIAAYCFIRIFEGFFRGMEVFGEQFGDDEVFLGLKVSQLLSIVVLIGLIPIAYRLMTTDAPDYEVPERLAPQPSRAQRRRAERRAATRKSQ
jgi:phosphatidylglycerol:prolipoprotein diacylglycerol transferase